MSKSDKDSLVYGVDYQGRVWCVNTLKGHTTWSLLPNPTNTSIKRVISFNSLLWGISSDHQIYVYVPKRDIAVRIREEIYENERWNPLEGFSTTLLPTDRPGFSNDEGTETRDKNVKLPSDSWDWEGEWQIENIFENELVAEGWTYAVDFPATYHPTKSWKSCVRRRKLFRYRRYSGTNRWNRMEPLQEDHTLEPFIDVGLGSLNAAGDKTCCLWAVSILGHVYFRCDVSITNPEGSKWQPVPIRKGLEACQITVAHSGVPFVVTWTGSFLYRIGITPGNHIGYHWIEGKGPLGGLLQLSAGMKSLWAITRDKKCWALKGDLQELIAQCEPVFEWIEIPGKMKSISVGRTDEVVLALSEDEIDSLCMRFGISEEQKNGQGWKEAFPDVSWDTVSVQSSASELDAIDGTGDTSLRVDIPSSIPYGVNISDTGPVSLSWVDGTCASCIRNGSESDLEVGPWRDEILQNLQKLKVDEKEFDYPNAIENLSNPWSKTVPAHMLNISRRSGWAKGFLEISNNDHLMFQETRGSQSWLCPLTNVLSVFDGIGGVSCLTLRIRNGVDPGVADYITFKFLREKDVEEWGTVINELSIKLQEEMSVANIWLTTQGGEIHRGGQIKLLDIPSETDVISVEPGGDLKMHYPLVQGFLVGSEIQIDISLSSEAQKFSFDLKGRIDTPFHFNPRFAEGIVVRNTKENEDWGTEERDGACPFRAGNSYSILVQCTQTHLLTTVVENKRKTIYSYSHRVPPRTICNLFIYGDINVKSIRYDPKVNEDSYQLEFVSSPVSGHFWKVEAASNGSVWAIGYDFNVWCYTIPSKNQKLESQYLGNVVDKRIFYIYENQRWNPLSGFGTNGLPTDRHNWTDETGRVRLEKDDIRLPSTKWSWAKDWEIDFDLKEGVDESGWQYAVDFPANYHRNNRLNDFVRRRRWKRVSRYVNIAPWKHVPEVKLIDLSIRMNEDCEWEVLGINQNGDVVVRSGIKPECLEGERWESLSNEKPFISISGWYGQNIWTVGKDGFAYIRYGNAWQLLDRPMDGPLKTIAVGPSCVWAVGTNHALYRRSETMQNFPEGREWIRVCDNVIQACPAHDGSLWALLKAGEVYRCTVAKRMGINLNSPGGIGWEHIASGPWRHCTVAGSFSRSR